MENIIIVIAFIIVVIAAAFFCYFDQHRIVNMMFTIIFVNFYFQKTEMVFLIL